MKTAQEKKDYFVNLRQRWQEAKKWSEKEEFKAAWTEAQSKGITLSCTGFTFTKIQMDKIGLSGTPYIDTKTFKGWKDSGYKVKKGEKSLIDGLTWIKGEDETENENKTISKTLYPKRYCLFHSSQVQPL